MRGKGLEPSRPQLVTSTSSLRVYHSATLAGAKGKSNLAGLGDILKTKSATQKHRYETLAQNLVIAGSRSELNSIGFSELPNLDHGSGRGQEKGILIHIIFAGCAGFHQDVTAG